MSAIAVEYCLWEKINWYIKMQQALYNLCFCFMSFGFGFFFLYVWFWKHLINIQDEFPSDCSNEIQTKFANTEQTDMMSLCFTDL